MLRLSIRPRSSVSSAAAASGPRSRSLSDRLQAAGRRVCRKYRQASIRRMQQIEYDRLRTIVPVLARITRRRKHVSKVTIIEETIRYIDQLHRTLAVRLQSKTGGNSTDQAVADAHRLFIDCTTTATDSDRQSSSSNAGNDVTGGAIVAVCEKERRVPMYVTKAEAMSSTR